VSGFAADTSQLARLGDQLRAAGVQLGQLDQAHTEAGRVVVNATRPPRDTGHLANSLTAGAGANGVVFASAARYWTFVHWGAPRRHVRARPFYAEALRRSTTEVLAVYAEHAQNTLDKIGHAQ
jgi:hypothetical protein